MCTGPRTIEPGVVWLTGLPGAGKSTIGRALYEEILRRGVSAECLDGDVIRDLFPATGFTRAERDAHVKRVGHLASRLEHHRILAICVLISPYGAARLEVRKWCRRFVEVYISTPLRECERRDPKGLYALARRQDLLHFTGVNDPYEPPESPDLSIDTSDVPVDESASRLVALLLAGNQSTS